MTAVRIADSPGLRAAIIVAARSAVRDALPWAEFERALDLPLDPAVRTFDAEWVARQVAIRHRYIRDLADRLGLDPDEAIRRYGGRAR